jgi:GDSL-like Lipase/Acylhydrolase family
MRTSSAFGLLAAVAGSALLAAGCGGSTNAGTTASRPASGASRLSIVSLGDSIASGEGINYGYRYSPRPVEHWSGGTDNPTWVGPYQLCHVSSQAYGDVVAATLHARFANFACTGSTYLNGIVAPRTGQVGSASVTYRPAQFGNWKTRTDLNTAYGAAHPDVVLVTLGADDVHFVEIIEACVTDSVLDPSACTASDPGPTIEQDYFAELPTLMQHYRDLVAAIRARGAAARPSRVPTIVFTTYPDPLPAAEADLSVTACPDAAHLSAAQISYLSQLLDGVTQLLRSSLSGEPGVAIADVSHAFDGHRLCSSDPWAYGPSVLATNPSSNAPYHPTPEGQRAVARIVSAAVPRSVTSR